MKRASVITIQRGDRRVLRRRRLARTVFLLTMVGAAASAVLGALRTSSAHVRVTVNGAALRVPRGCTVGEALARAQGQCLRESRHWPEAGDLVDVAGRVIGIGRGGRPRAFLSNGPASLAAPIAPGEAVAVLAGQDRLEALRVTATLQPYEVQVRGFGPLWRVEHRGVIGIRRVERGTTSGLVHRVYVADASPLVITRGPSRRGEQRVALTFDDGPNGVWTPQMLDILKEHEAHATFFVLGAAAKHCQQLLARIVAEGHELGLHSYGHGKMARRARASVLADLDRAEAAVRPAVQGKLRWYRPPYGDVSTGLLKILAERGYSVALWSVDPRDWLRPGSQVVYDRVMRQLKDGAVIVLHDGGGNRAGTVAAVKRLVPAIQAKGYSLVTLSELAGLAGAVPDTGPTGHGTRIASDDLALTVNELPTGVRLFLDDAEVECPTPPVEVWGQILVPAAPVLRQLRTEFAWDGEAKSLSFSSPRGPVTMKALEHEIEVGGRAAVLRVPLLLFGDDALVPIWVLCNAFDLLFAYDRSANALRLRSGSPITSLLAPQP